MQTLRITPKKIGISRTPPSLHLIYFDQLDEQHRRRKMPVRELDNDQLGVHDIAEKMMARHAKFLTLLKFEQVEKLITMLKYGEPRVKKEMKKESSVEDLLEMLSDDKMDKNFNKVDTTSPGAKYLKKTSTTPPQSAQLMSVDNKVLDVSDIEEDIQELSEEIASISSIADMDDDDELVTRENYQGLPLHQHHTRTKDDNYGYEDDFQTGDTDADSDF